MDEIIKIVLERNKERKLLSSDDVKTICSIIIKKNKYDFIKQVEVFSNNPNDPTCAAVYYDDKIFFFYKETIDMLQENFECFTEMYEVDGSSVDIYNYFYLSIIFHELAHVRQHAILKKNHSSIEKKIFSLFLKLSRNRDFYNDNYHDILTEVNANNASLMTSTYIYSKMPKNFITQNDYQIYQSFLLKSLLHDNYQIISSKDEILSPAERVVSNFDEEILFYLDTNLSECVHLIYDIDKLTIYKKLILGLPISYLEYAYSNLIGDRLNQDERVNVIKKLQKNINSTKS